MVVSQSSITNSVMDFAIHSHTFCVLQQLSPDDLAPELRDLIGDQVGDVAKVAVVILCEQKIGQVRKTTQSWSLEWNV